MAAAAEASSGAAMDPSHMKLTCSHGGRFVCSGPNAGAPRYVGGQTRVLAVPRSASFRDLAAWLSSEMAAGAEVRALQYRLADTGAGLEDVIVSVACDDELAHMVHEHDRLRAARPNAAFRVFLVSTTAAASRPRRAAAAGLPPLPPKKMRRVQSEQALPARAQLRGQCPACPAPMRRVQSAHLIAGSSSCLLQLQPSVQHHQYCRRVLRAPVAAERLMYTVPYMSKNASGVRSGSQEHAPTVPAVKAAGRWNLHGSSAACCC